jgi:predicted fused transcriptional regulator/phosphomethylpyrimidine kinase/predicted transcriptional regulator
MNPPFSIIADEIIPHVRKRVAQELYQNSMSQDEIASVMGTSQAMISKYLRDHKSPVETLEHVIEDVSRELTVAALSGEDSTLLTTRFNSLLFHALAEGRICARHNDKYSLPGCKACFELIGPSDRGLVLRDLGTAASYFDVKPIPDLIPAVKINIAQIVNSSGKVDDIASFPGRISFHEGKVNFMAPEFGASGHLAGILSAACQGSEEVRAVINLRYDPDIGIALEAAGMSWYDVDRSGKSPEDQIRSMDLERTTAVVDPGDFGIEPCLYVFGGSALEVVSTAYEIQESLMSNREKV